VNAQAQTVVAAPLDWTAANQQALAAEFASLRARILGNAAEAPAPTPTGDAAIDHVVRAFGLSGFERSLLLLCAGVEMDTSLMDACIAAGQRGVTFGFALGLLDNPHWSALAPSAPLRRWRLLDVHSSGAQPLTSAALRIDERVVLYLAGLNQLDTRLAPLLRMALPSASLAPSHDARMREIVETWHVAAWPPSLVTLIGDDPEGAEDIVAHAAAQLGQLAYVLRAEDLPTTPDEIDSLATLWQREAVLLPAVLLVACDDTAPNGLFALAERVQTPLAGSAREPLRSRRTSITHDVRKPDRAEQASLWRDVLPSDVDVDVAAIDAVAGHFRFSAHAIADIARDVEHAIERGDDAGAALWNACRRRGRRRIDDLAQHIEARAQWDDLVLPPAQTDILRQIAVHLRHRLQVYDTWGFGERSARGLGLSALFSGESGTGKTLAAEVIANELSLDLYRIDLASVVSKYIGETEKNLRRVFEAAEDSGAILVFDEADALFGKRSDVKDSHDRYANIATSYLLQRMEAYRGLAILTTNMKSALDPAFKRRLRFIVHFPFPDAPQREAIWRRAFPADAPTRDLDFAKLAALHATGGTINNVAMHAAFLAADAGEGIGMPHLLRAAQAERAKSEKPLAESETRGWV
jgi:hypothetical protein